MHLVYIATCHPKIFFIPNRAYLIEKTVYVLDVFHIEIKAFERDRHRICHYNVVIILRREYYTVPHIRQINNAFDSKIIQSLS